MLFDVQAALSDILTHPPATSATYATLAPEAAPLSRVSRVSQGGSVKSKTALAAPAASAETLDYPYGLSITGDPLTWTGRPVTCAAWAGLSDWERHGSTGLLWNALARQWDAKGAQP